MKNTVRSCLATTLLMKMMHTSAAITILSMCQMLIGAIITSSFERTIITIMNSKRLKSIRMKRVFKKQRKVTK